MDEDDDVPARVFEGMFVGGELLPDETLAAALRDIGYHPEAPRKTYSARVWRAALEAARRHVYPLRPEAEGFRALGRRFTDGFGKTLVGKVFRSVAPLFGVDRTFLSVPRYLHAVRRKMDVQMHAVGVNHYRLIARDPHPNPEFIAGCMLGILDVFSLEGTASVSVSEPERFELEFRWK